MLHHIFVKYSVVHHFDWIFELSLNMLVACSSCDVLFSHSNWM